MENLIHEKASGADLYAILNGGCITFQLDGKTNKINKLNQNQIFQIPLILVNTNNKRQS